MHLKWQSSKTGRFWVRGSLDQALTESWPPIRSSHYGLYMIDKTPIVTEPLYSFEFITAVDIILTLVPVTYRLVTRTDKFMNNNNIVWYKLQ